MQAVQNRKRNRSGNDKSDKTKELRQRIDASLDTLAKIADTLTTRGVTTKTGKSVRWTHQAVARILNRTT